MFTSHYFQTLAEEYEMLKRRLESLTSLSTEGNICAASALRQVLRRLLPSHMGVARGYVSGDPGTSLFEVLLYDNRMPLPYQEGDFVVVQPSAFLGAVEVSSQGISETRLAVLCGRLRELPGGPAQFRGVMAEGAAWMVMGEDATVKSSPAEWFGRIVAFYEESALRVIEHPEFAEHEHEEEIVQVPVYEPIEAEPVYEAPVSQPEPEPELVSAMPVIHFIHEPEPVRVEAAAAPVAVAEREAPVLHQQPLNGHRKTRRERFAKDTPDADGNYPLHVAVLSGDAEALADLLNQEANPDSKNREGDTALHLAARLGNRQLAELLIVGEADVNARNYIYAAPLHVAAEQDNADMVSLLAENGAEVEARNNRGQTPLHKAASVGSVAAAEALLDQYADILACMEKDMQPLHLAAWYGQGEMAQMLIRRGADINAANADGNTALHFAAFNNQVKVIKTLINNKADMGIRNRNSESYLDGLNEGYRGEMVRVLE
ncbi:MAG: hypothetical protein EAZ89_19060 [Bacteroidetes bacterium]|nr:MAG: hypothetical protein EAZ89_19060 [Bacteroidota bacterium]